MAHRTRNILLAAACAAVSCASAPAAFAQGKGVDAPPPPGAVTQIVNAANLHMKAAEESFGRGDFGHARTEFDQAMDVFLLANVDMRSDSGLQAAYRDTLERINRYQTIGVDAEGDADWPLQAYEATKDDFRPEDVSVPTLAAAASAGFENASFLVRVAELQRRFRERFGRDFTLTGRDTEVHARLYGSGRATDVRVSDLSQANVQFIVSNARALNMRVLDFSTLDRVAAHNAQVMTLGRPLDTLATGMHLHLNDLPHSTRYATQTAAKTRFAGTDKK